MLRAKPLDKLREGKSVLASGEGFFDAHRRPAALILRGQRRAIGPNRFGTGRPHILAKFLLIEGSIDANGLDHQELGR